MAHLVRAPRIAPANLANLSPAVLAGNVPIGVVFEVVIELAAGSAGVGDDTSFSLPFKFRVTAFAFSTQATTNVGSSTVNLRTAAAAGGTLIAGSSSANATRNATTTSMTVANVVAANTSIFIRRSDGTVRGFAVITCVREP